MALRVTAETAARKPAELALEGREVGRQQRSRLLAGGAHCALVEVEQLRTPEGEELTHLRRRQVDGVSSRQVGARGCSRIMDAP